MPRKAVLDETIRIDLGDDQWVQMRPMTIDDLEVFAETATTTAGPAIRAVKEACVESQFNNGKPLGGQSIDVFTAILSKWNASEDEVALPPANGQSSASPS